ncbi:PQQ-binding-like beta-propeller repeat protein [Streptomyces sp. NPDC056222]|uniref:outer membrane protein assembly factor BamB family protein n=1 Tax=Streptomyces sp. NPDC056222 TaxID=3345749 RepID=UPI0035E3BC65
MMAAAVVALASLATGCFFDAEPEGLGVVWDTPEDRKTESQGNGAWLSGDTLVRSRFDAVRGYDARTGKRSWEYVPRGRSAVCHVAADTDSSVLVRTRDGDGASAPAKGKLCADVVAIDMNNGREIWHTPLPALDSWARRLQSYTVSAGSGIAVLLWGDDLRAVDVRTGKTRWKAAFPKDCVPGTTAVSERQVAALLACGGTAEDDRLDGATGHLVLPPNGKLTVLTSGPGDSSYGFRVLDAATSEQREARSLPEGQNPADTLFTYKDRLIGARYEHSTTSSKPCTGYERRRPPTADRTARRRAGRRRASAHIERPPALVTPQW